MQLNTKPIKVALIAGIIALILIGVYGIYDQDAQVQPTPSEPGNQSQTTGKDPFKEFIDNQQQGTTLQPSQALPSQTLQIGDSSTATKVPVGSDPFKAFLEAQPKAKPEEAAISPFAGVK